MELHGINKVTLLDYPQHIATTVFTGACNFRCPFCQNAPLVLSPASCPTIDIEEFFSFLAARKGKIEGVCVTGGEPTLQKDLVDFIKRIKDGGYLVKLDTNGYEPNVLESLLRQGLLDMVAMDIKNSKEQYASTSGLSPEAFDLSKIDASIALLRSSGITHEFRTTVVRELHSKEEFDSIGRWLSDSAFGPTPCMSPYYLQSFVASDNLICGADPVFHAYSIDEMHAFVTQLQAYMPLTALRGEGF